jgi:hypothetical protein
VCSAKGVRTGFYGGTRAEHGQLILDPSDGREIHAPVSTSDRRGPHRETRLQQYLDRNGLPSAVVEAALRERIGGRAPHRKTVARWRLERRDVRRKDMVRILWAVRAVSGNANVHMEELFDLDPDNPDNWQD